MPSTIATHRDGPVATVTLRRDRVLNAVDRTMMHELHSALLELDSDDDVRAIVITGSGDRAFSSGFDIDEMLTLDDSALTLLNLERERWLWSIVELTTPVIAALNGLTYGAGALLAVAADLRLGCERTVFRFTAGAYNGANFTWCLPLLVGMGPAKEMLMTAAPVEPAMALHTGLLNRLVPAGELMGTAMALAQQIASNPPEGVRYMKRLIHDNVGRPYRDRFVAENAVMMGPLRPGSPDVVFSGFVERRQGSGHVG